MTARHSPNFMLVSDYRIPNPTRVWPLLQRRKTDLARIGAIRVIVHAAIADYGRVLVTIVMKARQPIVDLLRSRVFFDWFAELGVDDLPTVFAGRIIEVIGLTTDSDEPASAVVLAAMTAVDDVEALVANFRSSDKHFADSGGQKIGIYQAFDDPQEVLMLQQIDNEDHAWRWIADLDSSAAKWMAHSDLAGYPPLFVGKLWHDVVIDEAAMDAP